jgi:hypothetical protein
MQSLVAILSSVHMLLFQAEMFQLSKTEINLKTETDIEKQTWKNDTQIGNLNAQLHIHVIYLFYYWDRTQSTATHTQTQANKKNQHTYKNLTRVTRAK